MLTILFILNQMQQTAVTVQEKKAFFEGFEPSDWITLIVTFALIVGAWYTFKEKLIQIEKQQENEGKVLERLNDSIHALNLTLTAQQERLNIIAVVDKRLEENTIQVVAQLKDNAKEIRHLTEIKNKNLERIALALEVHKPKN